MGLESISKYYLKYNLCIILFLSFTNLLGLYGQIFKRLPFKIDSLFALNVERNIPTFYSGVLLIVSSLLLILIFYVFKNQKKSIAFDTFVLSQIFLFLSYDELFQIHEFVSEPIKDFLNLQNNIYFRYTWVIPYFIFAITVFYFSKSLLIKIPINISRLIILSGFIYVFGELFLEIVGSFIDYHKLNNPNQINLQLTSYLVSSIEEILGMLGINIFNYSLLKFILQYSKIKK